jgi:hypothetical protein
MAEQDGDAPRDSDGARHLLWNGLISDSYKQESLTKRSYTIESELTGG